MSELLSAVFSFSQFKTAWDWIGLIADIFGFVALGITIWQIFQVKGKINSSIDAMNELKRLQEQELLKKIFVDLSDQQGALCWLLEKNGQNGYRIGTLQEKNSEIIFRVNHCINELPAKYKEITKLSPESPHHPRRPARRTRLQRVHGHSAARHRTKAGRSGGRKRCPDCRWC